MNAGSSSVLFNITGTYATRISTYFNFAFDIGN
jgi:hypothetical protein